MSNFRFSFGLEHPPDSLQSVTIGLEDTASGIVFGMEDLADFVYKYGHLSLLLQNLEAVLKSCVGWMVDYYNISGIYVDPDFNPRFSKFADYLRFFEDQLTQTKESKDFIRRVDYLRRRRNELSHQLTDAHYFSEYIRIAGRAKLMAEFDELIQKTIAVTAVLTHTSRRYHRAVGLPEDVAEKQRMLKEEASKIFNGSNLPEIGWRTEETRDPDQT